MPSVLASLGIDTSSQQRPAVLRNLDLTERAWTLQVKGTEKGFYRVIGAADGILAYAESIGQQWLQGIGVARLLAGKRKPKSS
ncbi:MAG: hypothetical protein R3F15_02030 [Lysobacterales bacterium]